MISGANHIRVTNTLSSPVLFRWRVQLVQLVTSQPTLDYFLFVHVKKKDRYLLNRFASPGFVHLCFFLKNHFIIDVSWFF